MPESRLNTDPAEGDGTGTEAGAGAEAVEAMPPNKAAVPVARLGADVEAGVAGNLMPPNIDP